MMKLTKSSRVFRRAMAFVLAAAMTLSAPVATQASAASKKKVPTLSVKKKTLYYNKSGKSSFTLKVKKNKVKKIVKTKWTTSKKSIVKISAKKKTSVKVTAKKKGSAKITAKVTYKVGAKTKTKKLTCKITSKKSSSPAPATETPATSGTPATDAPTDVPATDVPATDVPATDVPATPEPTAEPTAEPTEEPADIVAVADSVNGIDSDFNITLTFSNTEGTKDDIEKAVKNAKLSLKKGNTTVTASFKEMEEGPVAVFAIDDTAPLKKDDRSADGKYDVTTDSKSLTLPEGAYVTYEVAVAALAVEGFVMSYNSTAGAYQPVNGATVTIIEGGKSTTTDGYGHYRINTVAGKKTMRVEKDGFVTQITDDDSVSVNKSQITAQNFVLASFDQRKVYVNINVINSKSGAAVEGATVELWNGDTKVATTKTSISTDTAATKKGHAVYANESGDVSYVDNSASYDRAAANKVYLEKGKTYTVKVRKDLSSSNLNDVYHANEGTVTIEGKYRHDVEIKMDKVAELPSMTIRQEFAANTVEGTAAKAAETTVYNGYQLFVDAGDNKVATPLTDELYFATVGEEKLAQNTLAISSELVNKITALNTPNKITLPTGKYYVLIKSYTTSVHDVPTTTSYSVVQVDVKEGEAATATVERTLGATRTLTTNVGTTAANSAPQTTTSGQALKNVVATSDPAAPYATGDEPIKTSNILYQKMANGALVKVEDSGVAYPGGLPVVCIEKTLLNGTKSLEYSANNEYTHLLATKTASYIVRTDETQAEYYVKAADLTIDVNEYNYQQLTINADSTWCVDAVTVKANTDDSLCGEAVPEVEYIRVVNSAGEEVKKCTFAAAEYTGTAAPAGAVANGTIITYSAAKIKNTLKLLAPGEYTVKIKLKDRAEVSSPLIKPIGLEKVTVNVTEAVKWASEQGVTELAGVVNIKKKDGSVVTADDTANKVQVMLYKSGKIAGIATTNATGAYTIKNNVGENRIEAGEYLLVARGLTAETTTATVTLEDKKKVEKTITMDAGAQGAIKVQLTDGNKNPIGHNSGTVYSSELDIPSGSTGGNYARVTAWDENWIDYTNNTNWVSNHADTSQAANFYGKYEDKDVIVAVSGTGAAYTSSQTERQIFGLSVGNYTLHFFQNGGVDSYKFANESKTLSVNGEKSTTNPYTFNPVDTAAGNGLVQLTVYHSGLTAGGTWNHVVVAKQLDENGKEIDQIAGGKGAIYYASNKVETYEAGASTVQKGNQTYSVLELEGNKTYNIYVYDFTGHYVAKVTKDLENIASNVDVTCRKAEVD